MFEIAKNGIWSEKFREIDLLDFTSFFGLDFFKFSGPLCDAWREKYRKSIFLAKFLVYKMVINSHSIIGLIENVSILVS